MQQSIEVLLLPLTELNTAIEQELQENPMLEADESEISPDSMYIDKILNLQIKGYRDTPFQQIYDPYSNDDDESEGKQISRTLPLEEVLLQQLRLEINDPAELTIGELIIGNLDEDGYFKATCEEIAHSLSEHTDKVEKVLKKIQNFEPIGIASRNLKECLLLQTHYRFTHKNEIIPQIIENYLDEIAHKKFTDIAKKLKAPLEQVRQAAKLIASLEPKPARKFRPIDTNIYIKPDVFVIKLPDESHKIIINNERVPSLRISSLYQKMLQQPKRTKEEIDFIRDKIKKALMFIRSIEQRHQTIKEISEYIVNYQKEFWEQGHAALKPMILKDVAQSINRNESTVCRAINGKYMDTPQGLLAMKFFFSQGVGDSNQKQTISNRSIKEEIRCLIEEEDKSTPLSDQDLQNHFVKRGMNVARRTVSKYRQGMAILPSHLRKN